MVLNDGINVKVATVPAKKKAPAKKATKKKVVDPAPNPDANSTPTEE